MGEGSGDGLSLLAWRIFWLTFHLIRADVMFPLGLVVSACVTWHVLLRKRQVPSAVGWIGLAWFAPLTGALVYFVFGVNRVQRRAPPPARSGEQARWQPLRPAAARR